MRSKSLLTSSFAKIGGTIRVFGMAAILLAPFSPAALNAQARQSDAYQFHNVVIGGGGFIPAIVFSTTEPGKVYARTDIGGAYRFDPEARRWIPLLDWIGFPDWNLTGVESIAIDPHDPERLYLAVGTYTNEWASQNGAILRSSNQGRRFQRFDLPFKVGSNMPGRGMGERLAIDPNNSRILYLGTRSGHGLWRSMDSGQTWRGKGGLGRRDTAKVRQAATEKTLRWTRQSSFGLLSKCRSSNPGRLYSEHCGDVVGIHCGRITHPKSPDTWREPCSTRA
jgi:hypothetical protein